jgi:carboxypeptidase-like protein
MYYLYNMIGPLISDYVPLHTKMRRKVYKLNSLAILFCLSVLVLSNDVLFAQSKKESQQVVQFTGVIVSNDGVSQVPGVHVYVPKSGRGTTTNIYGYFTMPALVGDEVIVSAIGFLKQHYIVPEGQNGRVNVLFKLEEDTVYLQNVDIAPFMPEREFKQAILALSLPDNDKILDDRLDGAAMALLLRNTPYDASLNARYYFDQQFYYLQDNYGPRSNPFLNPFNWSRFIKSLKKK